MEFQQLESDARSRSRYPGRLPDRGKATDDAHVVLAEIRAELGALLDHTGLNGARRDVVHSLAAGVDEAAVRLAAGEGPGANATGPLAEAQWLTRLSSDLEDMQRVEDVADLMARLAHIARRELRADACMVSFVDHERRVLRDVAAASGDEKRLNLVAREYRLDDYPVTLGVLETGVPAEVSVRDREADPAECELLEELEFTRVLLCPLTLGGETIGTIEFYRSPDLPFDATDQSRVGSLVRFASGPYERIGLTETLRDHYMKTLEVLTSALEVRDVETHQHTGRMREQAMALADAMRLSPEDKTSVRLGAMLHDVGKLGVPDSILLKDGPLTEEEWVVMRRHPEIGERMLSSFDFLSPALPVVRHHHERWDGKGYPDGLAGQDIPLAARIVAVCDALDAMTSDRPYRAATTLEAACEELVGCAGTQFDPLCVAVLVNLVKDSPGRELNERTIVRYAS